jgi:hypothetical protein
VLTNGSVQADRLLGHVESQRTVGLVDVLKWAAVHSHSELGGRTTNGSDRCDPAVAATVSGT